VLLYFSKQDFPVCPNYGDVFLIKGGPQIVPPPSNPDEFDYQRFLSFKNIYHQKYVRKSDVLSIGNEPPSLIDGYALDARELIKRPEPCMCWQSVGSM
jgi:competence protein ComEC